MTERVSNKNLFRKGETENGFYARDHTYLAESRISGIRFMDGRLGICETHISLAQENVGGIRPN